MVGVGGRWWLIGLCLFVPAISFGCSRSLAPKGAPPTGHLDAGAETGPPGSVAPDAGPDAGTRPAVQSDAGVDTRPPPTPTPTGNSDAGTDAPSAPAAHGVTTPGAPQPTLTLDGACDVTLMPTRAPIPPTGTLAAPGPYRQCDVLGGQSYSVVTASSDGRRVAALGVGGQVQVLDARTLATVATLTRARGAYTAVAISADGARVAAGAELDGELDVWSVDDHALLLAADLGPVWPTFGGAVAISNDGTRAAASSGPDTVLADVATGTLRRFAEHRTCCTNGLAFVDGGRKLASARYDFSPTGGTGSNVALIDVTMGDETLLSLPSDPFGIATMAVSGDGTTVITYQDGGVQAWDAATGRKLGEFAQPAGIGNLTVLGLTAGGGQVALLLSDLNSDHIWFQHRRTTDGFLVDEFPLQPLLGPYAWSSAERLFGNTASTVLMTVDVGAPRVAARACSAPRVNIAAFSRDGSRLLHNSGDRQAVIDAASGAPIRPVVDDSAVNVDRTTMSPDGRWVAWTAFPIGLQTPTPQTVNLAGVDDGTHTALVGAASNVHFGINLAFSADAARLAALDVYNGILDVFDVTSARLLAEQQLPQPYGQLLGFTTDADAVRLDMGEVIETRRWQDGAVLTSWPLDKGGTIAGSFDGDTILIPTGDLYAGAATTVYRDEAPIATLPGAGWDCFGGGPYMVLAPGGGTAGVGFSCSRPWFSQTVPGTKLYDTATGALVQSLPVFFPVLSWDGSRFAQGAVIWCR